MCTPVGGKWVFKVSTFYAGAELLDYDATFDSDDTSTSEDVSTQRSQMSHAQRLDEQRRFQQLLRLHLFDVNSPISYSDATKCVEARIDVQRIKAIIKAPTRPDMILGILNNASNAGYYKVRFVPPPIGQPRPKDAWVKKDAVTSQQIENYERKRLGLPSKCAIEGRAREIVASRNGGEGSDTNEQNA